MFRVIASIYLNIPLVEVEKYKAVANLFAYVPTLSDYELWIRRSNTSLIQVDEIFRQKEIVSSVFALYIHF